MNRVVLVFLIFIFCAILTGKSVMEYDLNNLSVQEFHEFKDELLSLNDNRDFRDEYLLEILYQEWENDAWVNEALDTYSYDGNGYAIELLQQGWPNGAWQNYYKMTFTNNAQGYPIETLWQMWDTNNLTWMNAALMLMEYDANNNMTEMLIQMWGGTEWMDSSRRTMTYNGDDNPTYILTEEWDFENGTGWMNDDQETFSYDGLFLEQEFEEDWENATWVNMKLSTYTLEGNYHPADQLTQGWNGGGYWDNQRYSVYTYDDDWNEIEDFEQEWNGDWVNFQWKFSTYNDDGWMTELFTQEWNGGRNWVNHAIRTMTYGNLSAGIVIPDPDLSLTNYPNPFNPETTIAFNIQEGKAGKLEIFSLKGQLIESQEFGSGEYSYVWNAADQASGIYFYKLSTNNKSITKKMLLMK